MVAAILVVLIRTFPSRLADFLPFGPRVFAVRRLRGRRERERSAGKRGRGQTDCTDRRSGEVV